MPGSAAAAAGITVGLHEVVRVSLRGVPANIVIADPQVADVNVTDPHNLVIVGKGRLLADTSVPDLIAQTAGGGVRVGTSEAGLLRSLAYVTSAVTLPGAICRSTTEPLRT